MKDRILKYTALILIVIGVITSMYLDYNRMLAENRNKSAEILLDFDEFATLAKANQLSLDTLATKFKEAGATGVLIRERTLDDLQNSGDLVMLTGGQIMLQQQVSPDAYPGIHPQKENTYLFFQDKETYESVKTQLFAKKTGITGITNDNSYYISLPLSKKEISTLGVGFIDKDLQAIHQGGLRIVPRLRTWPKGGEATIDLMVATLKKVPGLSMVTFNDASVPGQNNLLYFAEKLKELQVPVGIFEFYNQQGLESLAMLNNKNVVRIHNISDNDMAKYTQGEALDRYDLAVSERNIRALYVKLFGMEQPGTALGGALGYVQKVRTTLEKDGLNVGQASVPDGIPYSRLYTFAVGLGVVGAGILLMQRMLNKKWTCLLGLLGLLGWVGLIGLSPLLARKAGALLAFLIFPVLGMITFIHEDRRSLRDALKALLQMSGLSFLGAVILTGLLADKAFMLKLDSFSGVKLGHIAPLLVVPAYFIFRNTNPLKRMREILNDKVQVKHLVIGAVALATLYIYIVRTGNDAPALVSPLETKMRTLLDQFLGVRPRTKEFLLGHPAMLALLYYGYRYDYRRLGLLLLGVIGQVSLVDTYAHIHTPLVVSLIRSFHGLWIGVIFGILLIIAGNYVYDWYKRRVSL